MWYREAQGNIPSYLNNHRTTGQLPDSYPWSPDQRRGVFRLNHAGSRKQPYLPRSDHG